MIGRKILTAASVLALAACGGSGGNYERSASPSSPPPPMAEMAPVASKMMAMDQSVAESGTPVPEPGEPGEPGVEQFIAYSHRLGLSVPKGQVDDLMQVHSDLCRSAGTATCIVINSNIYSEDENYASGNLSIRATPDWIDTFIGRIASDAAEIGGEITQRSTSAEDLTRQIIDTDARLNAQLTLQSRLQGLLERRDGTLGDLLQIERELARVTGDIESIKAQLKTLRLRVAMSSLDINYQTKVPPFSATRENPLGEAFGDFFYNFSAAIASVITAFAVGLPWIVLIGLFLWIWLKLIWPRIRGKRREKRS